MTKIELDGPELWEIVFNVFKGDVPPELTDAKFSEIAASINRAFAPQPAGGRVKGLVDYLWQEFCELPDRTSPDDYPDHALVTQKELTAIVETWAEISALETQEEEAVDAETRLAQLEEIADGAWGDNPMVRGKARDEAARLRSSAHSTPVQKEEEGQTVSEDMVERAARMLSEFDWSVGAGSKKEHADKCWPLFADMARDALTAALVKP